MRFSTIFATVASVVAAVSAAPAELEARTLNVASIINLLGIGLVTQINTYITLETFDTDVVYVSFDVKNPLPVELTLDSVVAKATLNGTTYATFTYKFPTPMTIKPLATKNSGPVPNVALTQGLIASLDIVPFGVLDLTTTAKVRAITIKGKLGIPLTLDGLKQKNIPTAYEIKLD